MGKKVLALKYVVLSVVCIFVISSCAGIAGNRVKKGYPMPEIVSHEKWQETPPVGFPARGVRRNIAPGESIIYENLETTLLEMIPSKDNSNKAPDSIKVRLSKNGKIEEREVKGFSAFNWEGYHFAIPAVHTRKKEMGSGLTEFEITTLDSIPQDIAQSTTAGDAAKRARIPHEIRMITLHHSGSPKPLTLEDDPIKKLRGLQKWGQNAKNWWDLPYHFLIDLNGTIYEGRDYHYMGETNTRYNPSGHFLISVMGNYEIQKPTRVQIDAITDLMAWAVSEFNIPLDKIYGHKDLAPTACPGKYLYAYLEDGTFKQGIKKRLGME